MVTCLIGHRGVGKSLLLRRIEGYFKDKGQPVVVVDLDEEIAKSEKRSIREIFTGLGEDGFRDLEKRIFRDIVRRLGSKKMVAGFVAVGAGFNGEIPADWRRIWVRRPTDIDGRIFLDRPRLNPTVTQSEEYFERFRVRDKRFSQICTESYIMTEGFTHGDAAEEKYFTGGLGLRGATMTIVQDNFRLGIEEYLNRWKDRGLGQIELRDDLLTSDQFLKSLKIFPPEKVLVSFRQASRVQSSKVHMHIGVNTDWATELGSWEKLKIPRAPTYVSIHERAGRSLAKIIADSQAFEANSIVKLAVPVNDFSELELGFNWWRLNPERRVFLPISTDGRWNWFRLWTNTAQKLNFIREGDGTAVDQPTFIDWARQLTYFSKRRLPVFAGVLGAPVRSSHSPAEHFDYFANREIPFYAIHIEPSDFQTAMRVLSGMGLRAAAITSPLKELAYKLATEKPQSASMPSAINTLWFDETKRIWSGVNTDIVGFRSLIESARDFFNRESKIAIWGGGGTLAVLQKVLPSAVSFSFRTGQSRDEIVSSDWSPDIVVWAVGPRQKAEGSNNPPANWRPTVVIDLNYSENSPGREYAGSLGCNYISGSFMFTEQAREQRVFWGRYVGE